MRVTLEIPNNIAADLKRIIRRSYGDLSLPEAVATCVVYSLASSSRSKNPREEKDFAELALRLIDMQRSHE